MTHRVVRGDTLWSIAEQHTGRPGHWRALQRVNRLADPHQIVVGQVLRVPDGLVALPEAAAQVLHVHGPVQVTLPGRASPQPLLVDSPLPEGSLIKVGDQAFARLRLADGSAVALSAGSLVRLTRLRLNERTQQSQTLLRMEAGRVESDVVPKRHPASRFEIHTPMAVASVRGTRFGVSASPEFVTGDVAEGVVALAPVGRPSAGATAGGGAGSRRTAAATPAVLQPGQGARVGPSGQLQRGDLLTPPDLVRLPAVFDDGEWVRFELPAHPQAVAHRVRLLDAAQSDNVLREVWVNDPNVAWEALDDGRYLLAMQHVDALGLLGQSARHGFSVTTYPVPPLYRFPAPGDTVHGPVVSLRCTEPTGTQAYRLQVARDEAFSNVVLDQTSQNVCRFNASLLAGRYHWRVASLRKAEATDAGSAAGSSGAVQGPFSRSGAFEVLPTAVSAADATQPAFEPDSRLLAFWSPRPEQSYRVQIARDPAFVQTVFDDWVPGARVEVPRPQAGTHFLRWQSRDAQGRLGRLSPVHRVDVVHAGLRTSENEAVRSGGEDTRGAAPGASQGLAR